VRHGSFWIFVRLARAAANIVLPESCALRGYKAPRAIAGRPSIIAPNRLQRQFTVERPDHAWVTDITYIRTWQGWLYLAVVIDLSMKPTLAKELVVDALLMAVWRRKPTDTVIVHSDQGSQYGSGDWLRFCREHHLEPSMSRRGNCWDNAVVFYNRTRRHSHLGGVSPEAFERASF